MSSCLLLALAFVYSSASGKLNFKLYTPARSPKKRLTCKQGRIFVSERRGSELMRQCHSANWPGWDFLDSETRADPFRYVLRRVFSCFWKKRTYVVATADRNRFYSLLVADEFDDLARVVVFASDVVLGAAVRFASVVESMRICDLEWWQIIDNWGWNWITEKKRSLLQ